MRFVLLCLLACAFLPQTSISKSKKIKTTYKHQQKRSVQKKPAGRVIAARSQQKKQEIELNQVGSYSSTRMDDLSFERLDY